MEDLKFSVIGFGRIGQRHAKIINEFPGTKIISVTDVESSEFDNIPQLSLM
jgi:lactate dehydrogenase-like 2-hydroxyacid dehydrogenase